MLFEFAGPLFVNVVPTNKLFGEAYGYKESRFGMVCVAPGHSEMLVCICGIDMQVSS